MTTKKAVPLFLTVLALLAWYLYEYSEQSLANLPHVINSGLASQPNGVGGFMAPSGKCADVNERYQFALKPFAEVPKDKISDFDLCLKNIEKEPEMAGYDSTKINFEMYCKCQNVNFDKLFEEKIDSKDPCAVSSFQVSIRNQCKELALLK